MISLKINYFNPSKDLYRHLKQELKLINPMSPSDAALSLTVSKISQGWKGEFIIKSSCQSFICKSISTSELELMHNLFFEMRKKLITWSYSKNSEQAPAA